MLIKLLENCASSTGGLHYITYTYMYMMSFARYIYLFLALVVYKESFAFNLNNYVYLVARNSVAYCHRSGFLQFLHRVGNRTQHIQGMITCWLYTVNPSSPMSYVYILTGTLKVVCLQYICGTWRPEALLV